MQPSPTLYLIPLQKVLLTWNNEDISILIPVVGPVAGGAVADGEPQSLVRYQLRTEKRESGGLFQGWNPAEGNWNWNC